MQKVIVVRFHSNVTLYTDGTGDDTIITGPI